MCLTRRANKKVLKLTKLKNNKVYPEPIQQSSTPKFDVLLEKSTSTTKTKKI